MHARELGAFVLSASAAILAGTPGCNGKFEFDVPPPSRGGAGGSIAGSAGTVAGNDGDGGGHPPSGGGSAAGNGGNPIGSVAFATNGTAIVAIGPGTVTAGGYANAIVALDRRRSP